MTAAIPEYKDAIGQTVNGGDFVISIRDGTGAKARMAVKFTPAKVQVSSYSNNVSSMDACSLVVITPNIEKLIADGDQSMADHIADLKTRFDAMVEQPKAIKATNAPIRWKLYSYTTDADRNKVVYVSMHRFEGLIQSSDDVAEDESQELIRVHELVRDSTMSRTLGYSYTLRGKGHWQPYHVSIKDSALSRKFLVDMGIDGFPDNTLIPVAQFNNAVPVDYRITNV